MEKKETTGRFKWNNNNKKLTISRINYIFGFIDGFMKADPDHLIHLNMIPLVKENDISNTKWQIETGQVTRAMNEMLHIIDMHKYDNYISSDEITRMVYYFYAVITRERNNYDVIEASKVFGFNDICKKYGLLKIKEES